MQKHYFYSLFAIAIASCILLNGCNSIIPLSQATPVNTTVNNQEAPQLALPSGLKINEYALKERPQVDPLIFVPVQGNQADLIAKHSKEKQDKFSDNSFFEDMAYGMSTLLNGQKLVAREVISAFTSESEAQKISIDIALNDKVISTFQAGDVSPVGSLKGLWTYKNHWILETSYVETRKDNQNGIAMDVTGKIVQDGKLLNDQDGYQEMFGFQLINNKPFYFFKQNGQIGISYDDQKTLLGYDLIPHYACCSAAEMNPIAAKNMVAFFAQKNGNWYYVEIGIYQ